MISAQRTPMQCTTRESRTQSGSLLTICSDCRGQASRSVSYYISTWPHVLQSKLRDPFLVVDLLLITCSAYINIAFSPKASGWRYPSCVALLLVFGYQRYRQSLSLGEAICRSSLSSHRRQGFLLFLATTLHSYIIMVTSA
jgi:hypothetical protein